MVRVSSPAELRPWSELTAKMVMGVVPGLVSCVALVLLEAPKPPKNPSSSKVGPKVGFGGSLKVGQKHRNLCTFDLLLTYFQGPPETYYFQTYF